MIVRLVRQHPSHDELAVLERARSGVRRNDEAHPGRLELAHVLLGRTLPQPDVRVDPELRVALGQARVLEPPRRSERNSDRWGGPLDHAGVGAQRLRDELFLGGRDGREDGRRQDECEKEAHFGSEDT